MDDLQQHLRDGNDLSKAQVTDAAVFLLDTEVDPQQKAAFLRALSQKGETPAEIAAFVSEFLQHAVDPGIKLTDTSGPMLDVVGTGGDKLNLFNVSTTAMFVLAAGGVSIAKHGNRGITGKCGGADVLEILGVKIDQPPEKLARCVQEIGVGFLFAPLYHPAFKAVAGARKILASEGQRSIFNILGPLLNPARPSHQLVGVFDEKLVPVFAEILRQLGRTAAWVVHGHTADGRGMDELSTLGTNHVAQLANGTITHVEIQPGAFGFIRPQLSDLEGGTAEENADILEGILAGRITGPKRDLTILNAAAGFVITGICPDLSQGKALADDLISRGAAHVKLRQLQDWR